MYALALHGGAGNWPAENHAAALDGVRRAAETGRAILAGGGSALDAVTAVVVVLEEDPMFNAGTGAVLNLDGEAEMDAGIMDGRDLRAGGVCALKRVKNPILVARAVMEKTPHVLLAGEGALRFARSQGFADHDPVTPARVAQWRKKRLEGGLGTVGAVALDSSGHLAAATSSGGIWLKHPGRVSDSAIPGAGNYANGAGAASATGLGENLLRCLATRALCDRISAGVAPQAAAEAIGSEIHAAFGGDVGFVCLDARERIGVMHRTPHMPFIRVISGRAESGMQHGIAAKGESAGS